MVTIPDPKRLNDPAQVRKLMANAERLGHPDLVQRCKERLFELAGLPYDAPIERRFWETIAAYEEVLLEKNGRKTQASRIRRMLNTKTVVEVITHLSTRPEPSEGFARLVMSGNARYVAEHIVGEFPELFDDKTIDAALERLNEFEIAPPEAMIEYLQVRTETEPKDA